MVETGEGEFDGYNDGYNIRFAKLHSIAVRGEAGPLGVDPASDTIIS